MGKMRFFCENGLYSKSAVIFEMFFGGLWRTFCGEGLIGFGVGFCCESCRGRDAFVCG